MLRGCDPTSDSGLVVKHIIFILFNALIFIEHDMLQSDIGSIVHEILAIIHDCIAHFLYQFFLNSYILICQQVLFDYLLHMTALPDY